MMSPPNESYSLLAEYFGELKSQHCWRCTAEFGSWLSLDFGNPLIHIREAIPKAKSKELQRRSATIRGDFLLWIEMPAWDYFEGGKRRFHSEQSRAFLRRAAARLQSQVLVRVELTATASETVFDFDLGGQLRVRPASSAETDDPMWHLYAKDKCLSLRANGEFKYGLSTTNPPEVLKTEPCVFDITKHSAISRKKITSFAEFRASLGTVLHDSTPDMRAERDLR